MCVSVECLKHDKVQNTENSDGLHRVSKEFKWAEFFARRMRQQPVCLLGISSLRLGRLHETSILEARMVQDASSHLLVSSLSAYLSSCLSAHV